MVIVILLVLSIAFIVISTTRWHLHPFLALLFSAILFGLFSGMSFTNITASISAGFGGTLGQIGIVIILGTIIGAFLEKSGGAYSMAEKILHITGEKRVPAAMAWIGWFISIPVFADSGFVILTPLNRALSKRAMLSLARTSIALGLGLMASHTMVPPTPGPIAAAGLLEADLGLVLLTGIPVSLIACFSTLFIIKFLTRKVYIDPNPEISEEEIALTLKSAPSAAKSSLPIFIPILLIIFRSLALLPSKPFGEGTYAEIFEFIGDPIIALFIGMMLSFMLPIKFEKELLSSSGWVGKALMDAAIIIMITGAGGAFGKVLQNSGIALLIDDAGAIAGLGIFLPFLLTAFLKTAQGSSTVAIITAASIIFPLKSALGLDSEISSALLVIAIGAGSAVVSHANDSFFWILTQMSGMDVKTGYKLFTTATFIFGIIAISIIWIITNLI